MSCLLVVQPDPVQADALREALRAHITGEAVFADSVDDALSSIDRRVPDVVLLPHLIPVAAENYLTTYLGAIPGAGHVQILGLPRLERHDDPVQRQTHWLFPWRRPKMLRAIDAPSCDPGVFTQDVIAYLAGARVLKDEIKLYGAEAAAREGANRRREPRFAFSEVPWISLVAFGRERAVLVNVSSRGALLRTRSRPEHDVLRRTDPNARERSRLTLELGSDNKIHATGRVIRCVPLKAGARLQYEIAFSFDESVGLHLPESSGLVPARPGPNDGRQPGAAPSLRPRRVWRG